MKKICAIGHFGIGENLLNGQTVKTKIVTNELEKQFGTDEIIRIDTHGGVKAYIKLPFQMLYALISCENVIIFPAKNGIRLIAPILSILNCFFNRKLHYDVIGGWLPELLSNNKRLTNYLKKFNGIYVETNTMRESLKNLGLNNSFVIPNCKNLNIINEDNLIYTEQIPLKLCTFSRVMKEKGIEEAVDAVNAINSRYEKCIFTLDIFGQIDSEQIEWFENLKKTFPNEIQYRGLVSFDQSTDVLKNYYALLFPTYYKGEGFAGTLIDAMAAGIPVIASDWKYNGEIVKDRETGILIKTNLEDSLIYIYENMQNWNSLKIGCIHEAKKYLPSTALRLLIERLY